MVLPIGCMCTPSSWLQHHDIIEAGIKEIDGSIHSTKTTPHSIIWGWILYLTQRDTYGWRKRIGKQWKPTKMASAVVGNAEWDNAECPVFPPNDDERVISTSPPPDWYRIGAVCVYFRGNNIHVLFIGYDFAWLFLAMVAWNIGRRLTHWQMCIHPISILHSSHIYIYTHNLLHPFSLFSCWSFSTFQRWSYLAWFF